MSSKFKIKDLMVQLSSAAVTHLPRTVPVCPAASVGCFHFSCRPPVSACALQVPSLCHYHHSLTPPVCTLRLSVGCAFGSCAPMSPLVDPTAELGTSPVILQADADELAALKAQLTETLQLVNQREAELDLAMQPQTLEEVEVLEKELHGAQAALQARKAELAKAKK